MLLYLNAECHTKYIISKDAMKTDLEETDLKCIQPNYRVV